MAALESIIVFLLVGGFVGFIAGLLGAGGGGILVPILAIIFIHQGFSPDNAIPLALGTALACMILSSSASLRAHARHGTVVWRVVFGMAPGIILGAFVSSHFASYANPIYIAIFFSIFMGLIALQLFVNWQPPVSQTVLRTPELVFAGLCIGSISALAAVGGGFLMVAFLSYKNFNLKKAIGTSAATGFPIAVAGTFGYMINGWAHSLENPLTLGFIYLPAFVSISVASLLMVPVGARTAQLLPDIYLKKILAVLSLFLSLKMLWTIL